MKLVAREAESDTLAEWLRDRPIRITSVIGRIELDRAARRAASATGDPSTLARAADVIASVALAGVSDAIVDRAGTVLPSTLRSLDAVHLATAILAGRLEALVTYDDRLADAARLGGIAVVQPGRADAERSDTGQSSGAGP